MVYGVNGSPYREGFGDLWYGYTSLLHTNTRFPDFETGRDDQIQGASESKIFSITLV